MAKAKIEVSPEEVIRGSFVTATLVSDVAGDVTFKLDGPQVASSVELGAGRQGSFYAQTDGPYTVSFIGENGKTIARRKI